MRAIGGDPGEFNCPKGAESLNPLYVPKLNNFQRTEEKVVYIVFSTMNEILLKTNQYVYPLALCSLGLCEDLLYF